MTNSKLTKRSLLASSISLLLCVSMLIGTTFAWFTDSASSKGNKIMAGNLDVELYLYDGTKYVNISENENPIFGTYDSITANSNNANTLWEPGKTQVAYLQIRNEGNLALKYQVALSTVNPEDGKNLYEVMQYQIVPDATNGTVAEWNADAAVKAKLGTHIVSGDTAATMNPGDKHNFALLIHMDENADNKYMNGKVEFDITVQATQLASEEDSFGNDYDDAAWVVANADAKVSNATELTDALQAGGLIALTADINESVTLDNVAENTIINFAGNTINGTVTVAEGQKVTLNGDGGISATGTNPAIKLGKNTDVTIAGGTITSEDTAIIIANTKTEAPMTITIEEGTVVTSPTIICLDYMDGYSGAEVVINGGEFNSTYKKSDARPIKVHGGNVTINDGTFTIDNPTGKNCYFVDVSSKYNTETKKYDVGNVVINGGTFKSNVPYTRAVFSSMSSTHNPGTVEINGGTFEFTESNSYLVDAVANVVVNNCTYIANKAACVFNVSSTNPADLTITVNGGNYTVRTSPLGSFISTYNDRVILKGGTINSDKYIDKSLAAGYKLVDNGNGTYSIVAG